MSESLLPTRDAKEKNHVFVIEQAEYFIASLFITHIMESLKAV